MQPRTWVVSDLHLYQPNMAWDHRPSNHTEICLSEIQRRLRPGDLLIDLGDTVCSRLPFLAQREAILQLKDAAHGNLVKVRGNHCRLSDAAYLDMGVLCADALCVSEVYLSHMGTQTLPDDARLQVLGHYHFNPPNPGLPHAWRFSLTDEKFRPLLLSEIKRRADAMGLVRALPPRLDDRWFLEGRAPGPRPGPPPNLSDLDEQ